MHGIGPTEYGDRVHGIDGLADGVDNPGIATQNQCEQNRSADFPHDSMEDATMAVSQDGTMNFRRRLHLGFAFDTVATVAMISVAGVILWHTLSASPAHPHPQRIQLTANRVPFGAPESVGLSTATIGIIEFGDFQCPFCADFTRSVFPHIKAEYINKGVVRFDFRNFPLPIHALAHGEAVTGECLTKFRSFSSTQDYLFDAPSSAGEKGLGRLTAAADLAPGVLESCSHDPAVAAQVDHDVQLALRLGVNATPFFVVGRVDGGQLQVTAAASGTGDLADFEKLIDTAISR